MHLPPAQRLRQSFGKKRLFLGVLVLALLLSLFGSKLQLAHLIPNQAGFELAADFTKAAFTPATDYQTANIPADAPSYSTKILGTLWLTVKYALCALSISFPLGIVFGFLGSRSWWPERQKTGLSLLALILTHRLCRTFIAFGRSIHELLWAILFITALGSAPLPAILSLAIPYACTLAKVFSEIMDEQPPSTSNVLKSIGARGINTWLFSILPQSLPDILSYTFYRFECAIRSAAILGFVGIPTIGYHIKTAYAEYHLNEIWTLLYALLITLILIEFLGSLLRKRITTPAPSKIEQAPHTLDTLTKQRRKPIFFLITTLSIASLVLIAWATGDPLLSELPREQRMLNLERFLTKEIMPYPVQQSGDWADALPWAKALFLEHGVTAALNTIYIATAAMTLAFLLGLVSLPYSAKRLNAATPYDIPTGKSPLKHFLRNALAMLSRLSMLLGRTFPEYILAFLLLQIFGPSAWPLILGLAIHNYGIISRLGGEISDNAPSSATKMLLCTSGSRNQTFFYAILPTYFNRLLLFFFYRWETCIRDATVLGMVGIPSLGFLISESNARDFKDEMFFYILLSSLIVLFGDILSDYVRKKLR